MAESAKAPRVAEIMNLFCPGITYKVMDEGKAHLSHTLEDLFNVEKMVVHERNYQNVVVSRVIKHRFEAYPKLSTKIQAHYDTLFGKPVRGKKSMIAPEEEVAKVPLPFGFGAFQAHAEVFQTGSSTEEPSAGRP